MAKRAKTMTGKGIVDIWKREVGEVPPRIFSHGLAASEGLLHRLRVHRKLVKHRGCVNTVSFNADGDILITGSDDRLVIMWNWETGKVKSSFHSGHTNNIFQAKFMPHTNDQRIVTCAADGQVRKAQILENGEVHTSRLAKHRGRAHKLAIEPGSPHTFYSCGEDGLVQHFDLRSSSVTELFRCKSFAGISRYRQIVGLNAIAIDPRNPNLFVVGGTDEYARLYDIRKFNWDGSDDFSQPVDCFCPHHLIDDEKVGITGLAISNQSEILVSYNNEDIYLFSRDMGLGPNPMPDSPSSEESNNSGLGSNSSKETVPGDGARPKLYAGHKNFETVKGVSFAGPRDEYVVSGSDCGSIFIWRKKDSYLLRAMEADEDIVNCIESHPHLPILASSGLEHDIKIWTPEAVDKEPPPVKRRQVFVPRQIITGLVFGFGDSDSNADIDDDDDDDDDDDVDNDDDDDDDEDEDDDDDDDDGDGDGDDDDGDNDGDGDDAVDGDDVIGHDRDGDVSFVDS